MFGLFKKQPDPRTLKRETQLKYLQEVFGFKLPPVEKTIGESQYREAIKNILKHYYNQGLHVFPKCVNVAQVYEVLEAMSNQQKHNMLMTYNNSTVASAERRDEFYRMISASDYDLENIALDMVSLLSNPK